MTELLQNAVDRLIRDTYRPFDKVSELVRCFGEAALAVTDAPHAEIAVQAPPGDETGLRILLGGERLQNSSSPYRSFFPILYQKAEVGRITIPRSIPSLGDFGVRACSWIAKGLAHHLKRHEISELARQRLSRETCFIGTSEALSRVDHFVEQASRTSLPALIHGKPGTQLAQVALALHLAGPSGKETFLQANCAILAGGEDFERRLLQLLLRADGGTLLLSRLGTLDSQSQLQLCHILEVGISPWTAERLGRPIQVRLLATANKDLDEMAQRGEFSAELLAQLDFLRQEVAPLRKRREDIRPLIEFYLQRHSCGEVPEISEDVLEAFIDYDWPGNVAELSRVVARLAVLTADERVLPQHVQAYAPQILERPAEPLPSLSTVEEDPALDVDAPSDFLSRLESCHPSLRRAVGHIAANYQERLTLSAVAAYAHVSASHLAHLFQQGLGTTFTRFLSVLRLTEVKKLLLENPRKSITALAAEAGFSDFRHFERTFKRVVGCTPREFRRIYGGAVGRKNH